MQDRRQAAEDRLDRRRRELRDAVLSLNLRRIGKLKERIAEAERDVRAAEDEYAHRAEYERERMTRYQAAEAEWVWRNRMFHDGIQRQGLEILTAVEREKRDQEEMTAQFRAVLDRLYGMGVLYEEYRNPDAVRALKRYLEMGAADTLEGVGGAYRLYLEDQRMGRVMDSIAVVRAAVETGFRAVLAGQEAQYRQMAEMSASVDAIGRTVRERFQALTDQIARTGQEISGQIRDTSAYEQALLREIRDDQAEIGDVIRRSALNRYLVDKKDNLDNYLAFALANPLL